MIEYSVVNLNIWLSVVKDGKNYMNYVLYVRFIVSNCRNDMIYGFGIFCKI